MAVTKNISLDYPDVIVIGRRGENEAVDIVWDISPLVAEFGGGTALVLAKRATDESAYPVTLTEQTDTTLTWTVSSVDSCVIGVGKVQLFWYVGNVLAKSFMWRTFVGDDITGMVGDPPEAYESWLEHLAEMGADILNDAKDEVKNAEAWAVGERGGEPVVDGDETYHNNAKYWSGVSSDYAGNAESSADAAEQSAGDAAHQVELAEAQVTLAEGQVALAEQKVQDAAAQVALAEAQANAAAGSASDASGYALAASGYASDANTFSGQAYTSAQNAAQKASDAAGYALAASGSASDANTYKGQAQGFANSASGYANNASTYANNASGYADAASGYADAAAASATEAAGYVSSLVNGKAGVLEDSASGDVVSIVPDKSVGKLYKAEVSLSPIQSLNGYDHPWAGGAGTNKWDGETEPGYIYNGTPYSDANYWRTKNFIPVVGGASYYFKVTTGGQIACYDAEKTYITSIADFGGSSHIATMPSNCAYIKFYQGVAADKNTVAVNYPATVTTYSPYENLCPISGHTGATMNVTGGNLFVPPNTVERGSLDESGLNIMHGQRLRTSGYIPITEGETIRVFIWSDIITRFAVSGYTVDDFSTPRTQSTAWTANGGTVTIASGVKYIRLNFNTASGTPQVYAEDISRLLVVDNSTATSYTSSFGQTVYGGTFDFVSGKLVVEWANVTYDGSSDESWVAAGSAQGFYIQLNTLVKKKNHSYIMSIICDKLQTRPNNNYEGVIPLTEYYVTGYADINATYPAQNWLYAKASESITSVADFKSWLSANPIQVVYKLATPIEIDLDPTEVQTLFGLNNVWASDGEMSVDYAADLKTYIDNKIAAAVAALS